MENEEEVIVQALQELMTLYDIPVEGIFESHQQEEEFSGYPEMISKTQAKLDELNEKAEIIYEKTGMNREQLETFASNPNNFSREQWELLEKVKEACERLKRKSSGLLEQSKIMEKVNKERKKESHRFGKKKNWIPL